MTVFIFLGSLLAVMALGVPIAYALLLSGVALMWHQDLFDAQILAQNVINGADSFPLLAVPFFMLAGEIMNVGGLSRRIVKLALTLVGHLRGGLGFVAIVADTRLRHANSLGLGLVARSAYLSKSGCYIQSELGYHQCGQRCIAGERDHFVVQLVGQTRGLRTCRGRFLDLFYRVYGA